MRRSAALVLMMLVAGCATPAKRFGEAPPQVSQGSERTFRMSDDSMASQAVRRVLSSTGFTEAENADLLVEVGFSVRPKELKIAATGEGGEPKILSPSAGKMPRLCRERAFVLNVAFVSMSSGEVSSRSGATMVRCEADHEVVLDQLAQTALAAASD